MVRQNPAVAKPPQTVERGLAELVRLIRRPPPTEPQRPAMTGNMPADLQTDEFQALLLLSDERRALEMARSLLSEDLRFEHLDSHALDAATWRFVCLAHVQPKGDLVASFVTEHAREPMDRTCFFPIELLTVTEETELYGVRLMPPDAVELPAMVLGPDSRPTITSVIAIESRGTNYSHMTRRARVVAERALRLLRATLREDQFVPDEQLRFRLGHVMWFDDKASGWAAPPEEGWGLELDDRLLRHATSQEISRLPQVPTNDVERRAELALKWFDRAQLEVDPMIKLLFLFSALETILGDKSEGLKAPNLAIRRAMLGLLTSEGFSHPARTYLLYDEVRSAAVHGEEPPPVDEKEVQSFAWDIRLALNEFLAYARANGLTKRAKVRRALDSHERRDRLEEGLLRDNPRLWTKHLRPERPSCRAD